jgi:hypothetical protein
MIDAASMGDWWHAPADWHRAGCGAARDLGASDARTTTSGRGYFVTRYIDASRDAHDKANATAGLPKLHR